MDLEKVDYKGDISSTHCQFHGDCLFEKINTPAMVYRSADQGESLIITHFNKAAEEVFATPRENSMGKKLKDLFPGFQASGHLKEIQDCLRSGRDHKLEIHEYGDDKLKLWLDTSLFYLPDGQILAIYENVTEKQRLETRLLKSEKMEALGLLAGGIAHDFNNILSAILGYGELSLYQPMEMETVLENIRKMMKAGDRARNLIRQILMFSRQDPEETSTIFLKPIIKEACILLQGSLPASIHWEIHYGEEKNPIKVSPVGVHEVVMNLAINASHALDEEGTIRVVTEYQSMEKPFRGVLGDSPPGDYTLLKISDLGKGIKPEVLQHMFEPYFTTKESSLGTGMGLAIVFGIMKNHHGNILVNSELGKGTEFTLYFPQHRSEESREKPESALSVSGHESLLIVDDEYDITYILKEFFTTLGFKVKTFNQSPLALEAFKSQPEAYDLVITDQTMPNLNGLEMSRQMLQIRPDLPIVLCTGFSNRVSPEGALSEGIRAFFPKPLKIAHFAQEIRRILDES